MKTLANELESYLHAPPHHAEGGITATFTCPEHFSGFNGHFPQKPVLPGIVQLMMAHYVATMGKKHPLIAVKRAKFTRLVKPLDPITVCAINAELSNDQLSNTIQSTVTLHVNDELCAQCVLVFTHKKNA